MRTWAGCQTNMALSGFDDGGIARASGKGYILYIEGCRTFQTSGSGTIEIVGLGDSAAVVPIGR